MGVEQPNIFGQTDPVAVGSFVLRGHWPVVQASVKTTGANGVEHQFRGLGMNIGTATTRLIRDSCLVERI
jgi:hypothetical protein